MSDELEARIAGLISTVAVNPSTVHPSLFLGLAKRIVEMVREVVEEPDTVMELEVVKE